MGMSFSTVEEKKQVRWFVMRAYKNEKMAEDRWNISFRNITP